MVAPTPYVGSRPFERSEADRFFGRDREIELLAALAYSNRTMVLHASSGAGKTSLVEAGLRPRLESEGWGVLPTARVGIRAGGSAATARVNRFVASLATAWQLPIRWELVEPPPGVVELLGPLGVTPHGLSVVVIDQFEELFLSDISRQVERVEFVHQLAHALDRFAGLRLLLAVRDDYLGELEPLLDAFRQTTLRMTRLERLDAASARAAIVEPSRASGRTWEEVAAKQLVDSLLTARVHRRGQLARVGGEVVEPVQLQVVCDLLWRNLPRSVTNVTSAHLAEYGDVDRALADYYGAAVAAAAGVAGWSDRRVREWCHNNLVTSAGTRSTVFRDKTTSNGLPNEAVDELEAHHVLRAEARLGGRWYELSHDRLVDVVEGAVAGRDRLPLWARVLVAVLTLAAVTTIAGLLIGLGSSRDSVEELAAELATSQLRSDQNQNRTTSTMTDVLATSAAAAVNAAELVVREPTRANLAAATNAVTEARSLVTGVTDALGEQRAIQASGAATQRAADLAEDATELASANPQGAETLVAEARREAQEAAAVAEVASAGVDADATDAATLPAPVAVLEAEDADYDHGMEPGVDPDDPTVHYMRPTGVPASLRFDLTGIAPGEYVLLARANTNGSNASDSFYVAPDGRMRTNKQTEASERPAGGPTHEIPAGTLLEMTGQAVNRTPGDVPTFWLEVRLPGAGTAKGNAVWVNDRDLDPGVWDIAEAQVQPPLGWIADFISTRCGESFELHAPRCNPWILRVGEQTESLVLFAREPNTLLDSLAVVPW